MDDPSWKQLLLQWVSCFCPENSLQSIHDIRKYKLLPALSVESGTFKESSPFPQLLQYLHAYYPNYGLSDPENDKWSNEDELYLLAMLLLLHSSVFQPCETLQKNANSRLSPLSQVTVVKFLKNAMSFGQNISKSDLLQCIPPVQSSKSAVIQNASPLLSSPICRPQDTTPLAEFLSSPVARKSQRFPETRLRERIAQLETDLDHEQQEKADLIEEYEAKICKLERLFQNQISETITLKETLAKSEEDADKSCESPSLKLDRYRLHQEVKDSQHYIARLESDIEELRNAEGSLHRKISSLEKKSHEWESRAVIFEADCISLRAEVEQQTLENEALRSKCYELESARNFPSTPSRQLLHSPAMKSPECAPESLGPIIEMKLIEKETENEELKIEVSGLEKKLQILQSSFEDLQGQYFHEKESAIRTKVKSESRIAELDNNFAKVSQTLKETCDQRDELLASVKIMQDNFETTSALLRDAIAARDSAISELHGVSEEKHVLDVKVARLNAKLQVSEESREDLNETLMIRSSELVSLKEEQESLQVQVRTAVKERDKMEQALNDIAKKKDHLQREAYNMEVEKENLQEMVSAVELKCEAKEKLLESYERSNKELQDQLTAVIQEKNNINLQLQNVISERDNFSASCTTLTKQNNAALAQVVALTDENVRIEALLHDSRQQKELAYSNAEKLLDEKNKMQDYLNSILVENERLSCQVSIITQQESDVGLELKEVKVALEKQLASASQEIQKYEDALKSYSQNLSEVLREKDCLSDKLSSEINQLSSDLVKLQHISDVLSCEKENLNSELLSVKEKNSNLQQQIADLHESLTVSQLETTTLKSELDTAHHRCEELNSKMRDLESEKAEVEADLVDYLSRLRTTVVENSSLESEVKSLTEKLTAVCEEKLLVEEQLKSLQFESSALSAEKDTLLLKLQVVVDEKNKMQSQLHGLNETRNELIEQFECLKGSNSELRSNITLLSSQLESAMKERENLKALSEAHCQALQDELQEKGQQLSVLHRNYSLLESDLGCLREKKEAQDKDLCSLAESKSALEADLAIFVSKLQVASSEIENMSAELSQALDAKEKALQEIKNLQDEIQSIGSQLETEQCLKEKTYRLLKSQEDICSQLKAAAVDKDSMIKNLNSRLAEAESEIMKQHSLSQCIVQEKNNLSAEMSNIEFQNGILHQDVLDLRNQIKSKDDEIRCFREQLKSFSEDKNVPSLVSKLELAISEKEAAVEQLLEAQNSMQQLQLSLNSRNEELKLLQIEKQNLERHLEDTIRNTQTVEELMTSKNQISASMNEEIARINASVIEKDKLISSLQEELSEWHNKIIPQEVQHAPLSESVGLVVGKGNSDDNKPLEEERVKKLTMEFDMNDEKRVMKEEIANLRQQLAAARSQDKLIQLEQDEYFWQVNRLKSHLEYRLDGMMSQKCEVEEHLSQLRAILDDVGVVCENLYSSLPANCDAVHEVTNMKREVEKKLRAVDKKYADSLCGVIKTTYDILKWIEKQNKMILSKENPGDSASFFAERDSIESNVTAVCDLMISLVTDVRAAMNSCKFLSERCESYLKAQTRESLLIKTSKKEFVNSLNSTKINVEKKDEGLESPQIKSDEKGDWFGGASTVVEGYSLLKDSYLSLEKQFSELQEQQKKNQHLSEESPQVIAELQAKINALMLRPSQDQIDEKLKELHVMYADKLEGMKLKMKQVVNEEVQKVEQEKVKSEKEIIAKYNKKIVDFEEHIQQLSSQLWKLGEKLLQEEQDHRNTEALLKTLRDRQLQYITSNEHRSKSLDRLDLLIPATDNPAVLISKRDVHSLASQTVQPRTQCLSSSTRDISNALLISKRDVHSQASQTVQPRTQSLSSLPRDISNADEVTSRQGTKMAPASMGLAFPEEDEDGEVFNNDYLTELKEGRCRPPAENRRLSELQYRNSLCPPHLKSSYPLETQFHDPKVYKEEDLKGPDDKLRRPAKDRGTTSYKKPGPPTPSRKAGRLSLQGKEDLTPRAVLREHNESQTSYGSGMLRAAKTTPSRLRALFTSSKVANASMIPSSKRDENSTPGTPSSKRLSIFRRKFGGSKDNHNVSSGYSSFR